ncbi:hypothetical protein [Haloferula sp.]
MLAGAMWKLKTDDIDLGWAEIRRQLARLRKVHDHGRYTTELPAHAHR